MLIDGPKVLNHLNSKWNSSCPTCGNANYAEAADRVFQLLEFNQGSIVVGGPVMPVVPVICRFCGNVQLLSAITAGVVKNN